MKFKLTLVVLAVAGMFLGGCSGGKPVASPSPAVTEVVAAPVEVEVEGGNKLSDYKLSLKTLSKECTDSYGCVVTVSVRMGLDPGLDREGDYLLTYVVKGDESGDQIGTVKITGDQYRATDHLLFTKNKSSKVTIKGTELEKL